MSLQESGGDECSRAEKRILSNEEWDIIQERSSYQCKTEPHERLHLVPIYRRPMTNQGVEALDERVVGRCHVAKCLS